VQLHIETGILCDCFQPAVNNSALRGTHLHIIPVNEMPGTCEFKTQFHTWRSLNGLSLHTGINYSKFCFEWSFFIRISFGVFTSLAQQLRIGNTHRPCALRVSVHV